MDILLTPPETPRQLFLSLEAEEDASALIIHSFSDQRPHVPDTSIRVTNAKDNLQIEFFAAKDADSYKVYFWEGSSQTINNTACGLEYQAPALVITDAPVDGKFQVTLPDAMSKGTEYGVNVVAHSSVSNLGKAYTPRKVSLGMKPD